MAFFVIFPVFAQDVLEGIRSAEVPPVKGLEYRYIHLCRDLQLLAVGEALEQFTSRYV